MKCTLFLLLLFFSFNVMSSENFDEYFLKHKHGGIIKKTSSAIIELTQENEKIKLYVTFYDYENVVGDKVGIKAEAEINGKPIPLELVFEKDHYLIVNKFKKTNNFKLNVFQKNAGKVEKVSFVIDSSKM